MNAVLLTVKSITYYNDKEEFCRPKKAISQSRSTLREVLPYSGNYARTKETVVVKKLRGESKDGKRRFIRGSNAK